MRSLLSDGFKILDDIENSQIKPIVESLGSAILETDVKIDAHKAAQVFSAEPMEWHQDSPEAKWIVWHCIHPGVINEEPTQILDGLAALNQTSLQTRERLKSISVNVKSVQGNTYQAPLLNRDNSIYYCPWLLSDTQEAHKEVLAEWQTQLLLIAVNQININWKIGRTLIIDNHRFLHKRPRLNLQSKRHLKRYWIKQNDIK